MNSFLAVVFFCLGNECYFWSGQKLHATETQCVEQAKVFLTELNKNQVEGFGQCIKVPLRDA